MEDEFLRSRISNIEVLHAMLATLSPEGRIQAGLTRFRCSQHSFRQLAENLGARVAVGPFSEAMNGKRVLDQDVANRLLNILARMDSLENSVGAPVDFSRTAEVANILTRRMLAEVGDDYRLDELAQQATDSMK